MSDGPTGMVSRLPVIESVNALVAFLFAASAPVAIILSAGMRGGLEEADLASWIFAAFVINGVLTILMSVIFRQPLAFFWTIPGTVLVGAALPSLGFAEVIGAYILTGILLLVLGLAGWVRLIMDRLPMPIVMGMVAGVFVQFGLDWIHAFKNEVMLVTAMTAPFFFLSAVRVSRASLSASLLSNPNGALRRSRSIFTRINNDPVLRACVCVCFRRASLRSGDHRG